MPVCAGCGQENPDGFRFCGGCGATLLGEPRPAREERKVVTVLFCDLVGFTARAERLDPEDVRALLAPYHERVKGELERFGGTVEKFIGDAVVAVFGAPVAHEDDPERAVRAALAIRDWATEQEGLELRIGITTGEALVNLAARPERGEGIAAGDVVNTAARLQSAAPVHGVLVDETTYRATRHAIELSSGEPVTAKGKAEPVRVWTAVEAHARLGADLLRSPTTPLVGRERELDLLTGTLDRVLAERSPQLVTLVGAPGIGKSRLVYELMRHVDAKSELVTWRQGRSLPYGEGVALWALGEIVKAQAGILESDSEGVAAAKLDRAVGAVVEQQADAGWVVAHLRPLVGLAAGRGLSGDRREEAFTAWRRLLEALAERRPLVLVFEDLQWADEALLDFVDHLVDWTAGVPLLVVATARPELLDRRASWGGGKLNAVTLAVTPLAEDDTARLIAGVLERSVLPAETQTALVERAGGNPLYAEQFARLYLERGRSDDLPLPETLLGLIAARLDCLPAEEKRLLQHAAVIGKVFWAGALRRAAFETTRTLHALERKEFVRRERRSAVDGEQQYAFPHALVRDVAYGQVPRVARAEKHRLAAEWIAALGRPEDHAEMLAHHYLSALELATAAGVPADELVDPARAALRRAGERALSLNAAAPAARFFAEALDLMPAGAGDRPDLLLRLGSALHRLGDERSIEILEEAGEALLAAGQRLPAAEAYAMLAEAWWRRGERDRSLAYQERATELVADAPPSAAKTRVLAEASRFRVIAGSLEAGLVLAREAFEVAEALELTELAARALTNVGLARTMLGDQHGLEDIERSIELARSVNSPEAARGYHNLAVLVAESGHLLRAISLYRQALDEAERLGDRSMARHTQSTLASALRRAGDWDEARRLADALLAETESGVPHYQDHALWRTRGLIRLACGDEAAAIDDVQRALGRARRAKDPQAMLPALSAAARIFLEVGRQEAARELAFELVSLRDEILRVGPSYVFDFVLVAAELGLTEELRAAIRPAPVPSVLHDAAAALILEDELARAADLLDDAGHAADAADVRLRAAEQLAGAGRRAEAGEQLRRALGFWRAVGATRYVRQAETLLAASA